MSLHTFTALESEIGEGFSLISEFALVNTDNGENPATSEALIVYDEATGELFYNEDKVFPGLGEGGLFAILEGMPILSSDRFIILE